MTALTHKPTTPDASILDAAYVARFPVSAAMAERAARTLPGGIAHDSRRLGPFPVYSASGSGTHKTLVDGHRVIDYVMGHGSLLFGHSHPIVSEAIARQAHMGTHLGSGHEAEIEWAEAIHNLVPGAEQVRLVGSGTEATLLAMRLARAYTGREKMILFEGHFHGWQDYATPSQFAPFDGTAPIPGLPAAVRKTVRVLPTNLDAVEAALAEGDVAGVILEASGAGWTQVPLPDGFLEGLRRITEAHGVVLIFDEVITGFRWSPGGAQGYFNVIPDLTTLAKIVAGGLPGGAVGGKAAIMELLSFRADPEWNRHRKVGHQGTFNANPLAAVAGLATLEMAADPAIQDLASANAAVLRLGMNDILQQKGALGFVYGRRSVFHYTLGWQPEGWDAAADNMPDLATPVAKLKAGSIASLDRLSEIALLLEGVHVFRNGGFVSAIHENELDETLAAWSRAIDRLQAAGFLRG